MNKSKSQIPLDKETYQRILTWYLFAVVIIAITIIVGQVLIQKHLNTQLNDSKIINISGKQRAISQKLVKEVLLLENQANLTKRVQILGSIKQDLNLWVSTHNHLQKITKSTVDKTLFNTITPYHTKMVNAITSINNLKTDSLYFTSKTFQKNKVILLQNESIFLKKMDIIVNNFDIESKEKLQKLKQKEYYLFAFSLFILLLEVLFIFRPLSLKIRNTLTKLIQHKADSENNTEQIQQLYKEKENSLQELQELNFVIDNAALFASIRQDTSIVFISKKFTDLLHLSSLDIKKPLPQILTTDEGQQKYLKEIFRGNRLNKIRQEEIKITTKKGEDLYLDMSIVPMHQSSKQQSILILCSDITERKKHQMQVEKLTKENFEERILQKKIQASLIVEGQEEERKRIAKDIHDGIGQMLTALKFNIESINVEHTAKTKEKISYIKTLTADLIKGVRTATFNLTPPELSDHGIFPALQKMTVELSKLTSKNILFENKVDANLRFNSLAETNIYRVTQEAINNAIKYADSNYILLSINFTDGLLSIVIDDDGKGFDPSIVAKAPKNNSEGGMGLFFMKERISFINGRLFINAIPGEGTRITINYKTPEEK